MKLPNKHADIEGSSFMSYALKLAALGGRDVAPNPMVGAVIECRGEVIGEGYHQIFGGLHAEVNAINSVQDRSLLPQSTLYVTLEPCSQFGKTPPCVAAILAARIPHVVIGSRDPNETNSGGVEQLQQAGIKVTMGVLEAESKILNKRFEVFHRKKRPYIILKWAESKDGMIAPLGKLQWLTTRESKKLVHKWRSEECAIMVGTETAAIDDPALTVREVVGKNPLRIVLDRQGRLSPALKLFDGTVSTLMFTEVLSDLARKGLEIVRVKFDEKILPTILEQLHQRAVLSVMVEGGAKLLNSFIEADLWDEARVFVTATNLGEGVAAPKLEGRMVTEGFETGDLYKQYIFE